MSVHLGWILIAVMNWLVIDLLLFTIYYLALTVYVVFNGNPVSKFYLLKIVSEIVFKVSG